MRNALNQIEIKNQRKKRQDELLKQKQNIQKDFLKRLEEFNQKISSLSDLKTLTDSDLIYYDNTNTSLYEELSSIPELINIDNNKKKKIKKPLYTLQMSLIKEIFTRISTRSDLILIDTNTYIHNFLQNSDNDNLENVNKLKKELKNLNDFTEQLTSDLPNKLLEKLNICNDSVKKLEESLKRSVLTNITLISKNLKDAKTSEEINNCKVSYDRLKKDSSNVISQYYTTFNFYLSNLDNLFKTKQQQNLPISQNTKKSRSKRADFLGPGKNRSN